MIAPKDFIEKGPPPRFGIGQVVRHVRYGYRGVIVDYDEICQAADSWYQKNQTQPERKQPWYHVLVDGAGTSTYAAQSSLTEDDSGECVVHPWINDYFASFDNGHYARNDIPWPYGPPQG